MRGSDQIQSMYFTEALDRQDHRYHSPEIKNDKCAEIRDFLKGRAFKVK